MITGDKTVAEFVILLSSIGAGVIQSVTGFGSGIFMMLFYPYFFPILSASALSSSISLVSNVALTWRYRKQCEWKLTLFPAIVYIATSSAAILFAPYLPTETLKRVFGGFLVILSIYFLTVSGKIKIKANLVSATICGALSGVVGGLFGIGGPPMVIFFLAALDDKEKYLGTIQFFFLVTSLYTFIFRIINGIYGIDLIPFSLIGIVGILVGKAIGTRIIDKINADTMKKLVYAFLGFSGLTNLM